MPAPHRRRYEHSTLFGDGVPAPEPKPEGRRVAEARVTPEGSRSLRPRQPSTPEGRAVQRAYEALLAATTELNIASTVLPKHHPAHQELDEARLALRVVLDTVRP